MSNDLLQRAKANMKAYKQQQKERKAKLDKMFGDKPEEKEEKGKRGTNRVIKSAVR